MTRSWWFPETSLFAFISCPQPLWNHLEGHLTPPSRGKVFLATLKAIGTMLPNADETRFLSASPHLPKSKGSGGISERHTERGGSSLSDIHLHLIAFRPSLTSPCSFSLVRFLVTGKWDSEWMLARIRVYVSCHSMFFFFFFFIGQVLVRWAGKMFSCSSYLAIYF